ncbi:MAG: hypothetical protein AB7O73_15140 [Bacteroidia bacterium]
MKTSGILVLATILLIFAFCKTKKNVAKIEQSLVTYTKDISPILSERCTPCHFPETGKKKLLNTYDAAKDNIDQIIEMVQLPKDDKNFMPFKSKKEPLNDSLINVLKTWKSQGTLK